ncbi:RBBP9/YdeN family alpha/beta hydrolase [Pannonibacter tanglangensis]|uniref:Alpha/beta fold hydrolase n=1 Tax=Pannonibacter tanglangensis TaxID=2750084 RepID=A0ABW9ZJF0_9HYPH|nr:alpha/beta fold hydrolase [Pannonibacter sp. XCT-34]NBN65022.1 alpha/beta fold hydrolase [Pannonibacter sp. XCT-34]
MTRFISLPGIGGSGPDHWQTHWEQQDSRITRFVPTHWDTPDLDDWCAALERAVMAAAEPPVLVAHSLACLLVAHWAARSRRPVRAALLVSVPDPAAACFPVEARSFAGAPDARLPFPAVMVASSNDPFATLDYARARSAAWGARLVEAGALGHINGKSGLGAWPEGHALLMQIAARGVAAPA